MRICGIVEIPYHMIRHVQHEFSSLRDPAGDSVASGSATLDDGPLCCASRSGQATAVFSLINGILLRPVAFDEPRQIVMIAVRWEQDRQPGPVSLEQFRDLQSLEGPFQQLAVRTFLPVGVAAPPAQARLAQAEFVSGDYFELLRIRPLAGRLFGRDADRSGSGGSCHQRAPVANPFLPRPTGGWAVDPHQRTDGGGGWDCPAGFVFEYSKRQTHSPFLSTGARPEEVALRGAPSTTNC